MKFTLSWLRDHLETDASLETISTTLSAIGLEVEEIIDPAETLAPFVVARVLDAKQHPNADRLRVCQVEIAKGGPTVEVVCGAPNARAGMIGVFAPIGTYVPGTGITLEERPVRGVVSNGMLVSGRELEISDDHDGIVELDAAMAARVGDRYIDVAGLNDPIIEIGLTPNRPDCTGVRGIARDLAAAGLGTLKPEPDLGVVEGDYDCPIDVRLEFTRETADACPVFAARYIRGITNGPSPDWLTRRLTAAGLRPISALVDATNYISLDRGRPLHVYDADKLTGAIRARLGKSGESFAGLDDKHHEVDETMCVIADDSGPLGLGGIVGGEASSCTSETKNILIECAYFDPLRTAATGRKLSIITDARYRFERGVDPAFVEPGLDLATDMMLRLGGGEPSRKRIAGRAPIKQRTIKFNVGRIKQLAGIEVARGEVTRILTTLGFDIPASKNSVNVKVPTWRPDVHGPADLVEEVVRIVGLDNVPSTPMPRASGVARSVMTPTQQRVRRARRVLAGRGMVEAVTWSFINQQEARHFGGGEPELELQNPISVEMSSMRPSLLSGLLAAVARNQNRGFQNLAVFEIGNTYHGITDGDQHLVASGVRAGNAHLEGQGRQWQRQLPPVDVYDAKADAAALITALGIDISKIQITRDAPAWFHPGRSGTIKMGPKNCLAHFGELHPTTLNLMDIDGAAVAFEVFIGAIPAARRKARPRPPMESSDLLPVLRDMAFLVDKSVSSADIVRAAVNADKALISDVYVFDQFEGEPLEVDKKSLAIEVTLQPKTKALTLAEIDALMEKVSTAVSKATGGTLRG